ncbi:MAG: LysR family transcriptional regulator [Minwuiales bacterium]|nr:LysR family transcriptional regulator [Minwuiales bacterium]
MAGMENLAGMAVFAAVVEARSFSSAAVRLALSKSAVSKQVSRLEDRLGARLLNRTTRRLSLTEVGETFYRHCVRVLEEAEAAEQAVTHLHEEPRGRIKINAPMSFGILHLADAIPDFLARYPQVTVDIDLSDRFVDLIEEGYDLAIRIANLNDSSLIARRLAPVRRIVAGSPAYFAARGVPERPADLKDHNCLRYTYVADGREWRFRGSDGEEAIEVSGSMRANNSDVLRGAALAGVGLMMAPTFIVGDEVRAGRLRPVLTEFEIADLGIYAVYPHKRHLSPKVRAFVDFLAERYGDDPYWDEGIP